MGIIMDSDFPEEMIGLMVVQSQKQDITAKGELGIKKKFVHGSTVFCLE